MNENCIGKNKAKRRRKNDHSFDIWEFEYSLASVLGDASMTAFALNQ